MPRVASDFDEKKITSYLVSKNASREYVCIICKKKIPKGSQHGFHYNVSKHMALWHGKLYDFRNKTMLDLVERYKKRVRKQQEKEVPENREGPEEEPDSTAGLQLQAAAIELPDQNCPNDVGRQDQQQSRQVEVEVPGSSRVKKKKFSSLPASSKESLQHLFKRTEEALTEDCKQEVVPMKIWRINAAEEHGC
ncbi:hypothetical protein DMENIID0001_044770 [Sergentomyia squamirostris]